MATTIIIIIKNLIFSLIRLIPLGFDFTFFGLLFVVHIVCYLDEDKREEREQELDLKWRNEGLQ